jgi:hypothetical protein
MSKSEIDGELVQTLLAILRDANRAGELDIQTRDEITREVGEWIDPPQGPPPATVDTTGMTFEQIAALLD